MTRIAHRVGCYLERQGLLARDQWIQVLDRDSRARIELTSDLESMLDLAYEHLSSADAQRRELGKELILQVINQGGFEWLKNSASQGNVKKPSESWARIHSGLWCHSGLPGSRQILSKSCGVR